MNQTSIWTAQATFGHDIKQTNAKALKFSDLPFDKEKLNAPVFISAIKLVLFLWARVCGSTWRSKTALYNRMKSSASSPPLQSSNNTANGRPLRFHIPAKEMDKQRHIKRRRKACPVCRAYALDWVEGVTLGQIHTCFVSHGSSATAQK